MLSIFILLIKLRQLCQLSHQLVSKSQAKSQGYTYIILFGSNVSTAHMSHNSTDIHQWRRIQSNAWMLFQVTYFHSQYLFPIAHLLYLLSGGFSVILDHKNNNNNKNYFLSFFFTFFVFTNIVVANKDLEVA